MDRKRRLAAALGTLCGLALLAGGVLGCAPADREPAGSGRSAPGAGAPSADPAAAGGGGLGPAGGGDTGGGGSGEEAGAGDGGSPAPGGPGPAAALAAACETGEFRLGEWSLPGEGEPGGVSGISVTGDAGCVRLRISFDRAAPGVSLYRPSAGNWTSMRLEPAGGAGDHPTGPVDPDLVSPDLALLSHAALTSSGGGLSVEAVHGERRDIAARVVPAEHHIDVFFRPSRPSDPRVDDRWHGGPRQIEFTGHPERGLLVRRVTGHDDGGASGWVVIDGYVKAPESTVVIRVHEADGDGVVCDRHQIAAGPPYLFSWFHDSCRVPGGRDYQVEVGWTDPAGAGFDVWQWYEVSVG